MKSSGKGIIILALIIGASSLGFGIFSYIRFQTSSESLVVGLWESLSQDTDNPAFPTSNDWLIEVGDEKIEDNRYVVLNQSTQHSNTRFHLVKKGWYKVNLHLMLSGVSSVAGWYQMYLLKNDSLYLFLLYEVSMNQNLQVSRHFYIDSDGNDYFEINCYNSGDSFTIESQQVFNQLSMEYVGDYQT